MLLEQVEDFSAFAAASMLMSGSRFEEAKALGLLGDEP
jgi:hypothetical protein